MNNIKIENMEKLINKFSNLHRLTGTADCNKAASYIAEQLEAYGVEFELHEFQGYFSNPIKSELVVFKGESVENIPSKPRSFSLNCPSGITGELVYDSSSKCTSLSKIREQQLYSTFRGKIVLSWNFYEDYVKKIESFGAAGLIHIWSSDENVIHEETVGPIWGTPTQDNSNWIPRLPVIGIKKEDGLNLLQSIQDEYVRVTINSWVENKVGKTSLPIGCIAGRKKEYILVSGHYDSWYEGVTDNAVGNAVCLEMANVFSKISKKMERSIKIAFWPGHSNGRYLGSTWYCDNYWKDLYDNCVAHINIDSPGSKGGTMVLPRTTQLEGKNFTAELIKEFVGVYPDSLLDIPRGADQSFWGVDIPFHIMFKYEPSKEKKLYNCPGSGGGWWWHSEYDSLDKVDKDILIRDAKLNTATVYRLACAKRLPVDFYNYFDKQKEIIENLNNNSDAAFDFQPILNALASLREKVHVVMVKLSDDDKFNLLIKTVGGRLNRLMYSSGSEYEFDNTFPSKPFPGLQKVMNIYKDNTPEAQFIFDLTGFIRQRNRIINEMDQLEKKLQLNF